MTGPSPGRRSEDDTTREPEDDTGREPGEAAGWCAAAASETGSRHRLDGSAAQDAYATWAGDGCSVVAVADGHGHAQHFRSGLGARLAASIACDLLATRVADLTDPATSAALLRDTLGPALVEGWVAACLGDARRNPIPGVEDGASETDRLRPYGSTVIAMAATPAILAVLQLGDGDAVVADAAGSVWRPLPEDDELDGVRTTSLCQPDPLRSMRSTALPVAELDLALGFLTTDGFGASQEDPENWWAEVGRQLVGHLGEHGPEWISQRLAAWLEEPAEYGGDDTTLGVVMRVRPSPTTS